MDIKIPEMFKSSDGSGKLSRTIKGVLGAVVFVAVTYTPVTQVDAVALVNSALTAIAAVYALYGAVMKLYNRIRR